jgi:hypothetical protein
MQAPEGTLISFATQPGTVALDGKDGNSPYTKALVQAIRKPGLDIFRTFNEIGLSVATVTGGAQRPWVSLSPIKGDFYFAGRAIDVAPAVSNVPSQPAAPSPCSGAESHWRSAEAINTAATLQDHLARFGSCAFAGLAQARLAALSRPDANAVAATPDTERFVLVVRSDLGARTVAEFVALAKQRPNKLAFVSEGIGTANYKAVEEFKSKSGIEQVTVPYRRINDGLRDLVGGHVEAAFAPIGLAQEAAKNGKVRMIGITGSGRSKSLPDIPTLEEQRTSAR